MSASRRISSSSGSSRAELALEPLGAGAEARELGRAARRAERRRTARAWPQWWQWSAPSPCSDERDVAVRAAERRPARAAVQRRRDAAAVEEQDRLAALVGDAARARRAAAPRADSPASRRRSTTCTGGSGRAEPAAELEPLEPLPALRPRRRAAVDGDRALERRALRGDGARVVARVGLLLVRGVVLLVDADRARASRTGAKIAERAPTTTRASPDAIRSRSSRRSASVSPEWRTATRSPKRARKRPTRLRRERDLGHEHDRAEPALERRLAGPQVDLGLAAAGRAVEQEVRRRRRRAPPTIRASAASCAVGQRARAPPRRRATRGSPGWRRSPRALRASRRDERERARRRRAVVVGEPEREVDERRRDRPDTLDGDRLDPPAAPRPRARRRRRARRARPNGTDTTAPFSSPSARYVNGPRESARGDERIDGGEAGHR